MYYVFESPVGPGVLLADFTPDDRFKQSWTRGTRFETQPPNPLILTWVPEHESGVHVHYYSHGPVLMSKALVFALREAGVHNLDEYPVIIKSLSGKPDCDDFLAINIIGVIRAADMEKSVVLDNQDGGLLTVFFEKLVIDPRKAQGHVFFRLAENVSTIIVHENVVKQLESKGGYGLSFLNPEDFIG